MHPDAGNFKFVLNNHFLARDHDITFNLGHYCVFPPSGGNHQLIFNFGVTAVTDYFSNFTLFYFILFNAILSTACGKLEDRF